MKTKKFLLLISGLLTVGVICWLNMGVHLTYLLAEVVYGSENAVDSAIVFSKNTGFYEKDFSLHLYAPSKEIYYTLDGSDPTRDSLKYEGAIRITDASQEENRDSMRTDVTANFLTDAPMYQAPGFLIDKCTVLKAVYYDQRGQRSEIQERVYFVDFAEKTGYDNVNILSISTDPENLFDEKDGIYVLGDTFEQYCAENDLTSRQWYSWYGNYSMHGREWEREANLKVFDTKRQTVLTQTVGIRIQGGASRAFYPKSLNIYARKEYGNNRLEYDFFETGYYPKRMTLSSGGNDIYGKMLDRLGAELTESCEFCTMDYEPYVLFLNGEYWGFYYLTEKYDEHYIEHTYEIDAENVVITKAGEIEAGTDEDQQVYDEMWEFIANADMTVEENYRAACELLDMQSTIDYFAAEIYMARNGDWPHGNYALWRSRTVSEKPYEDGKWRWMLFDVNTSAFMNSLIEHDTLAYAIEKNELFASLTRNEEFRTQFTARILEMADTLFEPGLVDSKITEYEVLMGAPMEKHLQRFFGTSNENYYIRSYIMREFAYARKAYVEEMLKNNSFL